MATIQEMIDFHVKENEKDDGYLMDVEIHNEIDFITTIQTLWEKGGLENQENKKIVNEYIKYCLAKQYQISKWTNQQHKFERKENWMDFMGMTLCPVTWLLETGLVTVGWINVENGDVYSRHLIDFARDGRKLKMSKPYVRADRTYINFTIDKHRQLSRHLLMWRSAMEIPYNVHFNENKFDIDHIDPGTYKDERTGKMVLNDDIKNLQILSKVDHSKKTFKDNPSMYKKELILGKTVYQWKDKEKTELIRTFNSQCELTKALNKKSLGLVYIIKKNIKFYGYYYSYGDPVDDLCVEGKEKYSRHTKKTIVKDYDGNEIKGYFIYNTGIIQVPNGRMTIGSPVKNNSMKGSRQLSIKNKYYTMYGLVNSSFNGPRKNKTDQTAHLRRDGYIKYTEKDLEWQTPKENQTEAHGKKVKVFNNKTGETIIVDSLDQASKKYDINPSTLSDMMIKRGVYTPKMLHCSHLSFEKIV